VSCALFPKMDFWSVLGETRCVTSSKCGCGARTRDGLPRHSENTLAFGTYDWQGECASRQELYDRNWPLLTPPRHLITAPFSPRRARCLDPYRRPCPSLHEMFKKLWSDNIPSQVQNPYSVRKGFRIDSLYMPVMLSLS
jgi:hypothetical protein